MITKTGAFRDTECTCECGNKHELYGGIGYRTVRCDAHSDRNGGGYYIHVVRCKQCDALSEFVDK
ncbi:hypothetical protein M3661_16890 [Paenibacillus sp. MER 180]|uniref:hypothetical protein n=1 Tax=Paenibacillus sp. MER 180 TaxID=2939570 RepID=UPI002040203F|nr:hypothetical protein [Paenibacillus sp. MER 180]MCM3291809.1 hypothetical protein [Paenibacillus sp. MER 180]